MKQEDSEHIKDTDANRLDKLYLKPRFVKGFRSVFYVELVVTVLRFDSFSRVHGPLSGS